MCDFGEGLFAAGDLGPLALGVDGGFVPAIVVVGEAEEVGTGDEDGILGGLEVGVDAEVVGGGPEVGLPFLELVLGRAGKFPAASASRLDLASRGSGLVDQNLNQPRRCEG